MDVKTVKNSKSTQLKKGDISKLQKHITANIRKWGFEDETLQERLLLLTEELGELVNACRKISGMNVDTKREIKNEVGEEVADIINLVFAVAIKLGLDVESDYLKKEEVVNKRIYIRTETK